MGFVVSRVTKIATDNARHATDMLTSKVATGTPTTSNPIRRAVITVFVRIPIPVTCFLMVLFNSIHYVLSE